MSDKVFVDTNVLIYAIESDGPDVHKSSTARDLLRTENVCISTQVLGEFFNAVTSARRASPLQHDEATAWIQLWKRFDVRNITVNHVDLALAIANCYRLSYYDALILSTAKHAACRIVYSEDMNDGQNYNSVTVSNPF